MIKPYSIFACIFFSLSLFYGLGQGYAGSEAYGLLYLETTPAQSEIALDGQFLDLNVWLVSVAPGTHELRVRKAGFKSHYQDFEIKPGQTLEFNIHLESEASQEYFPGSE